MSSLLKRSKEYLELCPKVVLMANDKAACNMNCACCYLPYEGVRPPESVLRITENLRTDYRIAIAGSEILTDLRYLEAFRLAGQKYILTNGLLLDRQPQLFETLREYGIEEIQISLNYRGQKDVENCPEDMVTRVVRAAKERGFYVRLACIVNRENFRDVDQMCAQVKAMGADALFLIRYIKSGSARTQDEQTLTQEERIDFFNRVEALRNGRYPKEVLEIRLNGNFGPRPGSAGELLAAENAYCYAGKNIFAVDPQDNVYGCPYLMDRPIGKLVDESRIELNAELCNCERRQCLTDLLC